MARKRNAAQAPTPQAGLTEIPTLEADDDGGNGAQPGGYETGSPANEHGPAQAVEAPVVTETLADVVFKVHAYELVGGRAIAVVDGRKVALANMVKGQLVLTFEGEQLAKKLLKER